MQAFINEHSADIIIGCEFHLNSTYSYPEVFPTNFTVIRKDRNEGGGGGGVFIAFKSNIPLIEESSLSSDAELVWAKLCISNSKPVFVCSFYRPPNNLTGPISELIHTQQIARPFINAGDFNFPAIQWEGVGCIQTSPTYGNDVNNIIISLLKLLMILDSNSLSLRNNHILDLVFTFQPELISDTNVIPGISDHDTVSFKIQFFSTAPPTKQLRKVYQCHKTNINKILDELNHFSYGIRPLS